MDYFEDEDVVINEVDFSKLLKTAASLPISAVTAFGKGVRGAGRGIASGVKYMSPTERLTRRSAKIAKIANQTGADQAIVLAAGNKKSLLKGAAGIVSGSLALPTAIGMAISGQGVRAITSGDPTRWDTLNKVINTGGEYAGKVLDSPLNLWTKAGERIVSGVGTAIGQGAEAAKENIKKGAQDLVDKNLPDNDKLKDAIKTAGKILAAGAAVGGGALAAASVIKDSNKKSRWEKSGCETEDNPYQKRMCQVYYINKDVEKLRDQLDMCDDDPLCKSAIEEKLKALLVKKTDLLEY